MTNLTLFENKSGSFDWSQVEDKDVAARLKAKSDAFHDNHAKRRDVANGLVSEDTIEKAALVADYKADLPRGQYLDACREELGVNKDQASEYLNIHRNVLNGAQSDDVLYLVSQMSDSRAANKLLKSDEETQRRFVTKFQETGKKPSQRDFQQRNEWAERRQHQQKHAESYDKRLEDAFADSPQSDFYKGSEPVVEPPTNVVETTAPTQVVDIAATSVAVAPSPAPSSELAKAAMNAVHEWVKTRQDWTDKDHMMCRQMQTMIAQYTRHH